MHNELGLLSEISKDLNLIDDIFEKGYSISVDHFKDKFNKSIFEILQEAKNNNIKKVDLFYLTNESLKKNNGKIDNNRLSSIISNSSGNVEYFAKEMHDRKLRESILSLANNLHIDLNDLNKPVDDIIDIFNKNINELQITSRNNFKIYNMKEVMELRNKKMLEHNDKLEYGYETLDDYLNWKRGEVFTLMARSGVGKTAWGLQLFNNILNSLDKKGLKISLEMQKEAIFDRLASTMIYEDTDKIGGWVNREDVKNMIEESTMQEAATNKYKNILIIDKDAMNIQEIELVIKKAIRQNGEIPIVLIDYLGYIRGKQNQKDYEKVSEIAREIKGLAKRLDIRIMLLAQTNREGGEDGKSEIKLHHLRGSGVIEESADIIVGVWENSEDFTRLHGKILKNRNGEKDIRFDMKKAGLYFKEIEKIELTETKKANYKG